MLVLERPERLPGLVRIKGKGIAQKDVAQVDRFEIPVHFLIGSHDLTAMPSLSKELFDRIEAPSKQYHVIENAAHSPLFEEPDRVREILRDIASTTGFHSHQRPQTVGDRK